MPALLVTILSGFSTFLVGSLIARVASLVVFTTIGVTLITGLLNTAVANIGGNQYIWFAQLCGLDIALSTIGSALILRATMNAWSLKPSSAITGGS